MMKLFVIFLVLMNLFSVNAQESMLQFLRERYLDNETLIETLRSYFQPMIDQPYHNKPSLELNERRHFTMRQMYRPQLTDQQCLKCYAFANMVITLVKEDINFELIKYVAIQLCTKIQGQAHDVCEGVVTLNFPIIYFVLKSRTDLSPMDFCEIFDQPNCYKSLLFPPHKNPLSLVRRTFFQQEAEEKPPEVKTKCPRKVIKIIHITDIHYDPDYVAGGNAKCGKPCCCRLNSGPPKSKEDESGYWGDYRQCDMPLYSIDNAFKDIMEKYSDAEMVLYTGDTVAHNVWDTTVDQIKISISDVARLCHKHFGKIPVYNVLGNHDTQPLNQFAPCELDKTPFNTTWLYEFAAQCWSRWLPQQARDHLGHYGYYYVDHSPNLRIIAMNANMAYQFNWWLLYDNTLFYEQLDWLWDTLMEAERKSMFVYIINHAQPGGEDLYIKWEEQYQMIKSRFSDIIRAEFVGHTHMDETRLMYDFNKQKEPLGVVFNGGSLTTYDFLNPNYRVFYADADTFEILDYDHWVYDMTAANENNKGPEWYLLYKFRKAFNLKSASPKHLSAYVDGLTTNKTLFQTYMRHKVKNSDLSPYRDCDDAACKHTTICEIVTSVYKEENVCWSVLKKDYSLPYAVMAPDAQDYIASLPKMAKKAVRKWVRNVNRWNPLKHFF